MPQHAIFGPMFAMLGLTAAVWCYMYFQRIRFIRGLAPGQIEQPGALERLSPPAVSNPSDNLKNLFEIPVLFYALLLYQYTTQSVDGVYVAAAWVFAGVRVLHSAVHCSVNIILLRFYLYAIATAAVWFIARRAALEHLTR